MNVQGGSQSSYIIYIEQPAYNICLDSLWTYVNLYLLSKQNSFHFRNKLRFIHKGLNNFKYRTSQTNRNP